MRAVTDLILERHRHELADGAVLIDPSDLGIVPRALFMIDHSVYQGGDPADLVSRRIQFIEIPRDGRAANAGFSPHLALDAATPADVEAVAYLLDEPWLGRDAAHIPLSDACAQIATEHVNEVRRRREHDVGRTLKAVRERLESEIRHWSARYSELRKESAAGKDVRLALSNVGRTIDELGQRLETREQELNAMREIVAATPRVVGRALVIPAGLLAKLRGDGGWSADAAARTRIEKIAMNAVIEAERTLGHRRVRTEVRLGHHQPAQSARRKAAVAAAHRSEGARERQRHGGRHRQRNARRLQSAGQVSSGNRACR
jgi:hypothetical protein